MDLYGSLLTYSYILLSGKWFYSKINIQQFLVAEVPDSRKQHGQSQAVGSFNNLWIAL
jgi:hypothetical protein